MYNLQYNASIFMKRLALIRPLLILLSCSACTLRDERNFTDLYEAFLARGEGVEGYEVTEIEKYDGFDCFCVRVCLNTDDAVTLDDYMWFEAEVMRFHSEDEANSAYETNLQTGVGGTCKRYGTILVYWMTADPFADLYEEVLNSVFG